jgi:hypothetical protein
MSTLLSTSHVAAGERAAYWIDMICDVFVQLDCTRTAERFHGEITDQILGPLRVSRVDSNKQLVLRSPRQIARSCDDYFLVTWDQFQEYWRKLDRESDRVRDAYGRCSVGEKALLARRLVEAGVTYVLVSGAWGYFDHHGDSVRWGGIVKGLKPALPNVDRALYALINDLKARGMLDSTLIIWGGEFGRTIYSQGGLTKENYGRDHHPRCFTMWLAGGGVKGGVVYGATDDFSYNIVENPVHVRDFHATILHLLGMDHRKFSIKWQGADMRLTGVDAEAQVVKELLA